MSAADVGRPSGGTHSADAALVPCPARGRRLAVVTMARPSPFLARWLDCGAAVRLRRGCGRQWRVAVAEKRWSAAAGGYKRPLCWRVLDLIFVPRRQQTHADAHTLTPTRTSLWRTRTSE